MGRVRDRWAKRGVSVPKGMLIHITLKMLSRRTHSGTELMDEIESYTGWRPSSGSIYPLLSSLNNEGVIQQVKTPDQSIKRFTITPQGKAETSKLEEHAQFLKDNLEKIRRILFILVEELDEEVFDAYSDIYRTMLEINRASQGDCETMKIVKGVLCKSSVELKQIKSGY